MSEPREKSEGKKNWKNWLTKSPTADKKQIPPSWVETGSGILFASYLSDVLRIFEFTSYYNDPEHKLDFKSDRENSNFMEYFDQWLDVHKRDQWLSEDIIALTAECIDIRLVQSSEEQKRFKVLSKTRSSSFDRLILLAKVDWDRNNSIRDKKTAHLQSNLHTFQVWVRSQCKINPNIWESLRSREGYLRGEKENNPFFCIAELELLLRSGKTPKAFIDGLFLSCKIEKYQTAEAFLEALGTIEE